MAWLLTRPRALLTAAPCPLPRSELETGIFAARTAFPRRPFPLLWCPQLLPLLKLRHDHIAFYRELFIIWNGQVGPSPHLRAAGAWRLREQGTEHRAPPRAIVSPPVAVGAPWVSAHVSPASGSEGRG